MFTSRAISCSLFVALAVSSSVTGALAAEPAGAPPESAPSAGAPEPVESSPAEGVAAPDGSAAPPVTTAAAPASDPVPASSAPTGEPPPVADQGAEASASTKGPLDGMRFEIGGRTGYAIPMGETTSGSRLSDYVSGAIPLILDASLRLKSGLGIGLYGGFGLGISGSALDGCSDCSANTVRFGVLVSHHLAYGSTFDPWVGAGIGADYLILSNRFQDGGIDYRVSNTYTAAPELSLHAGLDVGGKDFSFGPFASISYARYGSVSTDITCESLGCNGDTLGLGDGSIPSDRRSGHTWLMLGIRGTYLR